MKRWLIAITLANGSLAIAPAQAAPCLEVIVTGAQGGPQAYAGQAGPGTLVRYGDDDNNCNAVRLQFDAGRGPRSGSRRSASSPASSMRCSSPTCIRTTAKD